MRTPAESVQRGQAGFPALMRRGVIPFAPLLGQEWSQWIAPSPDHTAKLAFLVALGFVPFRERVHSRPAADVPFGNDIAGR
jgi:hypothetical protein